MLVNNDCHIVLSAPQQGISDYFYKNADADELIFIHEGSGVLCTMYGDIDLGYADYLSTKKYRWEGTNELAVMVDTFHPLKLTNHAIEIENKGYVMSWAE